ncbi:phosphatase PAP2 family protein, partial [Flavitalea flava]
YFLIKKNKRYALFITILVLSSTGLMAALKQVFHRQRPQIPIIKGLTTYSFPSGHTLSAVIFCSIVGYLVWDSKMRPIWKGLLIAVLLLLALIVGFSRIALNVHFATDVIAGFCLGVLWVILSFWFMKRWN